MFKFLKKLFGKKPEAKEPDDYLDLTPSFKGDDVEVIAYPSETALRGRVEQQMFDPSILPNGPSQSGPRDIDLERDESPGSLSYSLPGSAPSYPADAAAPEDSSEPDSPLSSSKDQRP